MANTKTVLPSRLKNPHQLHKDFLNGLARDLGRLAEYDEQMAADAVRYVVDGTDEEVLLRLAGLTNAAEKLCLTYTNDYDSFLRAQRERAKLMRPESRVAPEVWVRLAKVYEACSHVKGAAANPNLPPDWPAWLTTYLSTLNMVWHYDDRPVSQRPSLSVNNVEQMLETSGLPGDLLARALMDLNQANAIGAGSFSYYYSENMMHWLSDWGAYLARHVPLVRDGLAKPDAANRQHILRLLGACKFDCSLLIDLLAELGTGPAKTVRELALPILMEFRDRAQPYVERILAEGDAAARNEAALLLWRLFGEQSADVLRRHAEKEPAARVRQTIEKLLAAPTAAVAVEETKFDLPPVEVELGAVPLPEETKAALRDYFERGFQQAMRHYEQEVQRYNAPDRPQWMQKPTKPQPISPDQLDKLFRFVEGESKRPPSEPERQAFAQYSWRAGAFGDCLAAPGVELIHVVRLAFAVNHLVLNEGYYDGLYWHQHQDLEAYRARCHPRFGLRELDAAVATLPGGKPLMVARAYLSQHTRYQTFCDWEPEAVWPIFAENPDVLREAIRHALSDGDRRVAFRVLAMFPKLPSEHIPLLWDMALGESKADRPLAQEALATVPGKTEKVIVALGDGRQAIRAAAAEWLGEIGDPVAIEPLKAAFRKEKQEVVKGVIMSALDALGADVSEFLDRDKLLDEAKKNLEKKRPKGMEWVPLDRLPAVHWADTGARVDPAIVQWWVVQSIQQKSPVCGPILRHYLSLCRRQDTAELARFLLSSWIGHDTTTMPQEKAAELAQKQTDQQWAAWGKQQWAIDYYGSKDGLYRQNFQQFASQFLGSAISEKGLLAIVAAAGDRDCVRMCEQYIRKWFGNRLAQCKCLIEVLAWIDHPMAIQVLLGIATRFRTKALRTMAEEHVQALADRQGWTLDELADRTIPDAGFARPLDDRGEPTGAEATLVLDYGPRTFTVRLGDDLQPVITRDDGKTVKEPPAPAQGDDAEKAKAAKKAFSEAKKTVKEVVKQQTERLYEALCTQRAWRFADWQRYLAQHPIVGKLCCRLVWAAFQPEAAGGTPSTVRDPHFVGCFRPLEDGSLTNEKDEEVKLPPDAVVRLAHTCNVPPETAEAWLQHLTDYDVTPLFAQFGRATYVLPAEKRKETDIRDFEGYGITTFKLRGKATKLGYVRGAAEDGGWFYLYRKPFGSLGLQAIIEFTGSYLPEEDMPAALTNLYFTALRGDRETMYHWDASTSKLPLGKVPPVLLSECYNDVKQIAAAGSGFDPEWEEKCGV